MYLKYYYYYYLLLLSFIYYHHHPTRIFACISLLSPPFVNFCLSTPQFFVFFFSRRSEKRFLPLKIRYHFIYFFKRLETAAFTPQILFHALTGTCTLLTRRDLIHRSPSTYLHRREYICRKYTSSISIRTHF